MGPHILGTGDVIWLLAQVSAGDVPPWVTTIFSGGAMGVSAYLFLTRRQLTPGELEGRMKDQKEQFESRITDLQKSHIESLDVVRAAHQEALLELRRFVEERVAAETQRSMHEKERADRNEAKLSEAQQVMLREMMPTLLGATKVLERMQEQFWGPPSQLGKPTQ